MVMEESVGLEPGEQSGNGHSMETMEQLDGVMKRLKDLKRPDGQLVSLSKQELGLLQTILRSTTEDYREEQLWRMVDFMDDEQAKDHVDAFYEAKELGMDTSFNVAYAFALCSVNRKGANRNNLTAMLMDTIQFGQHARAYNNTGKKDGSRNPRSPIS